MAWFLAAFFFVLFFGTAFLLVRATKRLLQFDEFFQSILIPMQEYRDGLRRIATAEGILHDHPEVIAFHRANMQMLQVIEKTLETIKQGKPEEPKQLSNPPRFV